jgi:hypothetical protein
VESRDELVAVTVHGPHHGLASTVIPDGLTDLLDPAGDRRLADEPAAPDLIHQLLFRHHAVMVLDEVDEHAECLRLQ